MLAMMINGISYGGYRIPMYTSLATMGLLGHASSAKVELVTLHSHNVDSKPSFKTSRTNKRRQRFLHIP